MIKIIGQPHGGLPIKRCHLPGVKLEVECPNCTETWLAEFDGDDFNYPDMNEINKLNFICEVNCHFEWQENVFFKVDLIVCSEQYYGEKKNDEPQKS